VVALIDGKYEVLGRLAEGGMGAVYKVRHVHLDEVRVLKVLKPPIRSDHGARERFREEARMASSLRHPGLALIYDFAADPRGSFFIVMEYVEGVSLRGLMQQLGPLPIALLIEIGIQALSALEALHRAGIVHRDISPENLMVSRGEGGRPVVKIIDLGVAKRVHSSALETTTGAFFGKLQYASPEQLGTLPKGELLDGRADLYAMAGVLHFLATGRLAFEGDSPHALVAAHVLTGPLGFDRTDPEGRVPQKLRDVLTRAIAKNRNDRFSSAAEMAAALASAGTSGSPGGLVLPDVLDTAPPSPVDASELPSIPTLEGETQRLHPDRQTPWTRWTSGPPGRLRIAFAILVAVVGFLGLIHVLARSRPERGRAAVPAQTPHGVVLLTASPWAEILELRTAGGTRLDTRGATPLRLPLPAGRYIARLSYAGQTFELPFEVIAHQSLFVHAQAPGFDAERVARDYAR
jgi:serine/threonine-protein kinase